MFLCKYRGNVTARVMEESEIPPELLEYLNETKKEPNI